ncbi:MAG: [FeFe] hydrogenase H-cluster radical SAM maturase HydE [Eubacterium sp.]|jgi:biotin synthase|nr:[FeFe] hydrogenase H-cluster radical SAM maturase HydE [Eubacterium sp.]
MTNRERIAELEAERDLTDAGLLQLLQNLTPDDRELLAARAGAVREKIYGKAVYVRGLIEFSNICRNDCYYCGIRKSNAKVDRYRLTGQEILDCVREGYGLGFRTFVLQGGEDNWFTKERMASLIRQIKEGYPDCAVTLSLGERTREEYECWRRAGADRYLLRHETADEEHYRSLHPPGMSLQSRRECLYVLRDIGYQTGAGFMVGSPGQTWDNLISDLRFLQELNPHMIGIGPFLAHRDTPFAGEPDGSLELTLVLLSILRLMFPGVLLPATTALGTIAPDGRERGLQAGANVLMPNLTPVRVRGQYELYNNKLSTGAESAQCLEELCRQVESAGFHIVTDRGDSRIGMPVGHRT